MVTPLTNSTIGMPNTGVCGSWSSGYVNVKFRVKNTGTVKSDIASFTLTMQKKKLYMGGGVLQVQALNPGQQATISFPVPNGGIRKQSRSAVGWMSDVGQMVRIEPTLDVPKSCGARLQRRTLLRRCIAEANADILAACCRSDAINSQTADRYGLPQQSGFDGGLNWRVQHFDLLEAMKCWQ